MRNRLYKQLVKKPLVLLAKTGRNLRGDDMEKALKILSCAIGLIVIAYAMQWIVTYKFDSLSKNQLLSSKDIVTIKERERQLTCLAQNIYHEAGSEPFEGKVAVAQVTLNRASSGNFPNDICAVIYQKNVFMEKVVCQFSWYCENGGKPPIKHKEAYNESYAVAKKVLLEGFRLDLLKDAMYYHADYVSPGWKKEKIGKIGRHIFYRGV